ncbi:hypothetical protein T484DRAFT_1888900 [Baffinella frigidus]|nr:hypothetical protein T484DRAFT_1888900 [Cryptophyta sp. CCMP2293]
MRTVLFAVAAVVAQCGAAHAMRVPQRALASRIVRAVATCPRDPQGWLAPEAVAQAAFGVFADDTDDGENFPVPCPQGEYDFGLDFTAFGARAARAAEAAHAPRFDATAQHSLGLLLHLGVGGCDADAFASARWHAAAAAQGHLDALATLGGCVRKGGGCGRDEVVGVALIEACARADVPVGLNKLGGLWESGDHYGYADCARAFKCFEKAAEAGSALGLFNVGHALFYGIGVAPDAQRAAECWRAAAARAPDDGAEEAAFELYRHSLGEDTRGMLRLAAALEHPSAVEEEARRRR